MKQITLNIPEHKYSFFLELLNNLGIEKLDEIEIPEEHKKIVRQRIKGSKKEDLLTWDDAKKNLNY